MTQVADFFSFPREKLRTYMVDQLEQAPFRADQLFAWVYRHGVTNPGEMTNLSADFRALVGEHFRFDYAEIQNREVSVDGTRKYLFQVSPERLVESVMIKQPTRMTLCVSSQQGCGMGCTFCRTATMGFQANLTAGEIVRQVLGVRSDAIHFGDDFSSIVFMGMGEPLHNYSAVVDAIKILLDEQGVKLGKRKITVSSVGLVPAIEKFGREGLGVNLAISLNATSNDVRSKIMPINKRFPLERLTACLRDYPLAKRKRITIEYVMLHGVNDTAADLKRLPKLLHGIPCKVNLIPYNENAGLGFRSPPRNWIDRWLVTLTRAGFDTTIRWSKGADINAACGQLLADTNRAPRTAPKLGSLEVLSGHM